MARAPRRHGCETPLHPSQVAVVAIALLSAVVFYFSVQELPQFMQRALVPLYSVQLVVTALLFVIISRFDPGQPAHQAASPSQSSRNEAIAVPIDAALDVKASPELLTSHAVVAVCRDCGRLAITSDTRHCSRCRKCIPGYDHHCLFLNTCIGARNYPLFVGLLSCSTLLLLTQQIVTGYAVSCLLASGRDDGSKTRAAMLCTLSALPLLELVFLVVLGAFHMYIAFRGLTTYEWLYQWLERRNPKRGTASTSFTATSAVDESRAPL